MSHSPTTAKNIVVTALQKSGYTDNSRILSARYVCTTWSGAKKYEITFIGDEGERDTGYVYIDADGKGEY